MRVQSIWTVIQIRDPAGDGFLRLAVQMALGEMHRVAESHQFAQEVGAMAETLEDPGHLLPTGFGAPFVVTGVQIPVTGLNRAPVLTVDLPKAVALPPQIIISLPVQTAVW